VNKLFRNNYGRDNFSDRGNNSPINVGDEYDVKIEDVGRDEFSSISVKIGDVELSNETVNAITKKLMLSRGILNEKDKDFSVS
jgi:uncharacterized protein YciU (UPF0263 family)